MKSALLILLVFFSPLVVLAQKPLQITVFDVCFPVVCAIALLSGRLRRLSFESSIFFLFGIYVAIHSQFFDVPAKEILKELIRILQIIVIFEFLSFFMARRSVNDKAIFYVITFGAFATFVFYFGYLKGAGELAGYYLIALLTLSIFSPQRPRHWLLIFPAIGGIRSQLVAYGLSIMLVYLTRINGRRALRFLIAFLAVCLIVIVTVYVLSPYVQRQFDSLFLLGQALWNIEEMSVSFIVNSAVLADAKTGDAGRLLKLVVGLQGIADAPLFGNGLGSFKRDTETLFAGVAERHIGGAHNEWIRIAYEYGVVGISFFVLFLSKVFRSISSSPDKVAFFSSVFWLGLLGAGIMTIPVFCLLFCLSRKETFHLLEKRLHQKSSWKLKKRLANDNIS